MGDTLATALTLGLAANRSIHVDGDIDGTGGSDVDLDRLDLTVGDRVTLNMINGPTYTATCASSTPPAIGVGPLVLQPRRQRADRWDAPSTGTYYVGISGYNNITYNPTWRRHRRGYSGTYTLTVERPPRTAAV